MANEISLVTASGRTVTPKDDGIIYEVFSPGNGIIYGGAVTIKDSSTLHITAGHGIVCGRKFTIDDSDIPVALSGSGSLLGRLYIHLDLADAADPITLLVETGESLTPVVQDDDVNINNGVYEINIATFDVDTTTISNLVNLDVTVAPMGDMEGATAGTDGKGGYVPAPQAGDEDKVLKGDGTWGTAGDTATVRYVPSTDKIQLWDGTQWVDWKSAGLIHIWDAIAGDYGQTKQSDKLTYITDGNTATFVRNAGTSDSARLFFDTPVATTGTFHMKGTISGSVGVNNYFSVRKSPSKSSSGEVSFMERTTPGAFEITGTVEQGMYIQLGTTYDSPNVSVGTYTVTITEFYVS